MAEKSDGGEAGLGCLIGAIVCGVGILGYQSCTSDTTYDMALIGRLTVSKLADTYTVQYVNDIDNRKSQGSIKGDFDLDAIMTVMDAGIDKKIVFTYIPKDCFIQIKQAYKVGDMPGVKELVKCRVYANVEDMDASLDMAKYTKDMVDIQNFTESEFDKLRRFRAHK